MAQDDSSWRTAYEAYLRSTQETLLEFDLSESDPGPSWPVACAAPCLACRVSNMPKPKE